MAEQFLTLEHKDRTEILEIAALKQVVRPFAGKRYLGGVDLIYII